MSGLPRLAAADWQTIRLVVFDVDGTLYDQFRLRMRVLRDLLLDAARRRSAESIKVLRVYRRLRESLADQEVADFERVLIAEAAQLTGRSPERIRAIVDTWIEKRPLRYLATCRYAGVAELFGGLRRNAKLVGVLSDYPPDAKLAALGLKADYVICAGDPAVGLLKPNPRGLAVLMQAAGVGAQATVLIGDRIERDGAAARRLGVRPLIRSRRPLDHWQTFARFDDPIFHSFLAAEADIGRHVYGYAP
jgi:putative hydrolase of the HAD superfamily